MAIIIRQGHITNEGAGNTPGNVRHTITLDDTIGGSVQWEDQTQQPIYQPVTITIDYQASVPQGIPAPLTTEAAAVGAAAIAAAGAALKTS